MSPSARRSSLTFSPIKRGQSFTGSTDEAQDNDNRPARKTSFVTQTFIELSPRKAAEDAEGQVVTFDEPSSILKRKGSGKETVEEPNEEIHISRKRSILRKDSSYEDALKPILKNATEVVDPSVVAEAKVLSPVKADHDVSSEDSVDEKGGPFSDVIIDKPITPSVLDESSSEAELEKIFEKVTHSDSTSSEDLEVNSAFHDVIIDPIPGAATARSASLSNSRKNSGVLLASRQPVIEPSSVKISADGNLADKLQVVSGQAEAIKKRMMHAASLPPSGATSSQLSTGQKSAPKR